MFRIKHISRLNSSIFNTKVPHIQQNIQYVPKRDKGSKPTPAKPRGNAPALELIERHKNSKKTKSESPIKGDRTRLNIVSEDLCDHVIGRLTASLQKHTNCDIIDVNPGFGLWSSKLHNALKPRTHLLMEPDAEFYQPFLKPLLEKENSTYKLIPESGIIWENLKKLETEDYLPNQERLPYGDLRLEQENNSLLFIANLGYYPNKSYLGFPSVTTLMIHQLLSAVRAHSLFQSYGLVRMLVWMRDSEKKVVFPRVISQRRKFSVEAGMTCENIFEVAGSDELATNWRREHAIDVEGARIVINKMENSGIKTPSGRVGKLESEAAQIPDQSVGTGAGMKRPFHKELEELEARFARREFCSYHDKDGKPVYIDSESSTRMLKRSTRTPEWHRLQRLRYRANQASSNTGKVEHFLAEYDSIAASRGSLVEAESIEEKTNEDSAEERYAKWKADVEELPDRFSALLRQRIDDRRAFYQVPPILLWDRREAEPIKVLKTDFFPQHDMCLLDFQPKPLWPILQGKNFSNYDYFDFMIAALFTSPTQSVVVGLKALAPGADEWIIPRCPSLTNMAKGGVIDLDQLSIRTLNQEMLREIIEAWISWPFRPTKAEMMVRTGSREIGFEGEEEMEVSMPGHLG